MDDESSLSKADSITMLSCAAALSIPIVAMSYIPGNFGPTTANEEKNKNQCYFIEARTTGDLRKKFEIVTGDCYSDNQKERFPNRADAESERDFMELGEHYKTQRAKLNAHFD